MPEALSETISNFRIAVGRSFFWIYVLSLAVICLVTLVLFVAGAARNPGRTSIGLFYATIALGPLALPELLLLIFLNIIGILRYAALRRYFAIALLVSIAWTAAGIYYGMMLTW